MAAHLLKAGFDFRALDFDKEAALFWAAENGVKGAVRLLINKRVDIEAEDKDGRTALHYAGKYGRSDIADLLLKEGASVDTRTNEGQTALTLAARYGHDATTQVMLHGQADIEAKDNEGQTPIHLAAQNGYEVVVRVLLDNKANISARAADGWTALHYAARNGQVAVGRLLLERKADMDAQDTGGLTALHYAAKNGHEAIFKLLLDKNADMLVQANDGWTVLQSAVEFGHYALVKLLLDKKVDLEVRDNNGMTALYYAARWGHRNVVELLLDRNAELEARDNDGWTPLWAAARYGHKVVVALLLDRNADLEARDNDGWTPLYTAARFGHEAVVTLLLDSNANLEARDKEDKTPLHVAAEHKHEAVVRLLLDKNADISARDNPAKAYAGKTTVLQYAALGGDSAIVRLLLDRKADISAQDSRGRTALWYAISSEDEPTVRLLLDRGAYIEAHEDGWTALCTAACCGNVAITRLLLDRNADPEAVDNSGNTIVSLASMYGERNKPVIQLLQAKKDEISSSKVKHRLKREKSDINLANQQKLADLISAVENGDKDAVEQCLQPVIKMINETGQQWPSLLIKAIERGHEGVAKLLLDAGVEKDAKRLTTALGYAAKEGMGTLFSLLLAHGADINAEDEMLCWAAAGGNASIVRLVLDQTKKRGIESQPDGLTPLHQACHSDHFAAAQLLIEAGANLEALSSGGYNPLTPLYFASTKGGWRMAQLLIEKGANIQVLETGTEFTLLHVVCFRASTEFQKKIRLLLDSGVSLTTTDWEGRSALHALIQVQNIDGTQLALLKIANNGPELVQGDNKGRTVLHYAVIHGGTEFVELLLKKGAPTESRDVDGRTPLAVAAKHGSEAAVRTLVKDYEASTAISDNKDMTPLMIAAEAGELSVLKFLLTLHPDLSLKDSEGRTALHLATIEGFSDVVGLLLDAGSDPKLVDGNGYTAMDLAKKHKHSPVLDVLRRGKPSTISAPTSLPLDSIDSENTTFPHPVLKENRSVRILILEKGELQDPVCCSLIVMSLDNPKLKFEALSYVWGTEPVNREICFRYPNSKFYVRDNLLSALIRLRRREAPRKLWIDAICIDQNNRVEQGQQVQMMTEVYSRASEVAIWLGKEDGYIVRTFKEMENIRNNALDDGDFRESRGEAKWPAAVVQFFQNPWFERAWIFQEIICSKKATIYSGLGENPGKNEYGNLEECRNSKPWSLVTAFYEFTGEIKMLENLPSGYTSVMGPLIHFQKTRVNKEGTVGGFDLLHLLELRRDSKATQEVDKIYSLLGLSTQSQAGLLRPDYHLDPAKLYPTVAKLLMTSRKDLRLLSAVQHRSQDLPSWVPDWREPWRTKPLVFQPWRVTSTFRPTGSNTSAGDESSPYKAAEGCQIDIQGTDDKYLKVKGRNFSRIDVVLDFAADLLDVSTAPGGIATQMKLKGFPLDSKYPISDGNYLDAVCETIIADLNLTNQEKEGITYSKNKSILDCLELRKEFDGAISSRRLVLTANGFVGLGPANVALGDTICLLFGGSVMYAVRPEILGVGDHIFIGECYCHGVMNGEAVSMGQENHDDLYYTFY